MSSETEVVATRPGGPWGEALSTLRAWDPEWAETCATMALNPWESGILPVKTVELVSLAVHVACTSLDRDGTRRHVRAALEAGASRDEILMIFKMGSVMAIHSCSLGAPLLLEEAKEAGVSPQTRAGEVATPACDRMKAIGQWNTAWDPFYALDPAFTEQFMATGIGIYQAGLMSPKLVELLSIAFDASYTHMYAPGTRRHIHNALKAGATMEEIMEVLKICVVQGVQALNVGIPILVDEMTRLEKGLAAESGGH